MLRILIVDDHAVVRNGVKLIFADDTRAVTFGEAANAPEALQLVRDQDWDLVLMDIALGDRSGLEVVKELKVFKPKLPVLVLSMHSETQYARRAFKAGAAGYITKDSSPEELARAIEKVANGGKYVSATFAELLVSEFDDADKMPHERLSDREFEIMCLLASGKTVSEVANILFLSIKTISTYRTRLLDKMGMRTNAELTHYAILNKLV
ncbi:MAG TPA: response regulator transcription factor [Pyrinomonadaceae bacterium]